MSRINAISPDKADQNLKEIYQSLEKKLGKIPNIFQNMANSPQALKAFLAFSDAAEQTSLDSKLKEEIALTVAQANDCHYCLAAHSLIAKNKGINEQDILQARQAQAKDPKTQAVLKFAKNVVDRKGKVSEQDVESLKAVGVTDKQLVEIVLVVIVNMFTNYFNNITDPQIDFPKAPDLK